MRESRERGCALGAAARASAGDGADGAPRLDSSPSGGREQPLVLVVEDDPDLREALCLVIGGSGWMAESAANGFEALGMIRSGLTPSVIVLDLVMPVMDGWRFATELRRLDRLTPPVIVVSTPWNIDARRTAATQPCDWLLKPLDFRKLLTSLARACQRTPSLIAR